MTPGAVTSLIIDGSLSNIVPGQAFALIVAAQDAFGNVDSCFDQPVTFSLVSPGGQTLGGPLTATPMNGAAAFDALTLANAGSANVLQATGPTSK